MVFYVLTGIHAVVTYTGILLLLLLVPQLPLLLELIYIVVNIIKAEIKVILYDCWRALRSPR